MEQDAVLNEKVQLASLPDPNQDCTSDNSLILSGWGKDPFTPSRDPHILWAVKQGGLDIENCNRVTDHMNAKKIFFVLVMKENQETVVLTEIVEVKCSLNADVLEFLFVLEYTKYSIELILQKL